MSLASLCRTHRVSFELGSTVRDAAGGTTRESWTPVAGLTNLLCTIQNASHRERYLFAQRGVWLTSVIYLPSTYADLLETRYRVRELDDNRLFTIHSFADEAGRAALTKIYAVEKLA